MFYLLLIKYNNLKNFINYYKKNNNMVYVIIAIILSFMLFNKESFRNFSDFSILPSLLFILFFFSIILDLYNAANFGRYGFKDSVLLNVTFNYAIVIIYYGFLVIFIFTTHSLYKLEIDLFELFNYRFYLYFFNVYNNINILLTFLTILVILQLLQNFLKKEYNNNFKVKYILMFLILLYVYNFFSIIISLLFKTALNPNKFFNLNNGSLSFLTSKNDSLLKNSIYNDNTRSEWVGLQFEQLTNNYNKFIYFFFINLFFFLLFTSIFIFTILLNVLFYYNKKNSKQTLLNLYIYINESFVYFNIIYLLNVNNIVNILQILCF